MPTPTTLVEGGEELIRSVPNIPECHGSDPDTGALKLSVSAFNDPGRQPSVDRRNMLAFLDAAKRNASHGLVKVIASEVRSIDLKIIDPNGEPSDTSYKIDVAHRPIDEGNPDNLPPNPAHSQVESVPVLTNSRFKKLKERLAQIAERHGWVSAPP